MDTSQAQILTEKNWGFIVNTLSHATGFLEDIFDRVETSKDGKSYQDLSKDIDMLKNLLRFAEQHAIENETIHRMN